MPEENRGPWSKKSLKTAGVDDTENSRVFSLIQMRWLPSASARACGLLLLLLLLLLHVCQLVFVGETTGNVCYCDTISLKCIHFVGEL